MMDDKTFWCDNCSMATHSLEEMFDGGNGPWWPCLTWCPCCGSIAHNQDVEVPVMSKGKTPSKNQYTQATKWAREIDSEFESRRYVEDD